MEPDPISAWLKRREAARLTYHHRYMRRLAGGTIAFALLLAFLFTLIILFAPTRL